MPSRRCSQARPRDRMVETLHAHLDEVAERVIAEVLEKNEDGTAIPEVSEQLEAFGSGRT